MRNYILFISLFLLFQANNTYAQKWAVHFKDKNNTGFTIDKPEEFLSQRAIERRQKFNIAIEEEDLPVNSDYVAQLQAQGVTILATSKWLNCAIVEPNSQAIMTAIGQLDFVDKVVQATVESREDVPNTDNKWDNITYEKIPDQTSFTVEEYGQGFDQINQLNGIALHNRGYTGKGVLISIIDGGFSYADSLNAFQHIRDRGGIIYTRDVVHPGESIYNTTRQHGTSVFSCIGSKLENEMIGTAPDADFALIRTEDERTENIIEEYNLAVGLEVADSLGTDIVNISLGYSYHGDLTHTFDEMDGRQLVSSYAAYRAVEKGIFISTSAGNTGNDADWPKVGSPADTPEVTTVGAVDIDGIIAPFSSIGPNATGVPKPEIVACGVNTAVILPYNDIVYASGTSFSSPIICGMTACLIQAFPLVPPKELKQMIMSTGNYYNNYQTDYGYGIPDFDKVFLDNSISSETNPIRLHIYPNPAKDILNFSSEKMIDFVEIVDISGRTVLKIAVSSTEYSIDISSLTSGVYFAIFTADNRRNTEKFIVKK